MAQILKIVQIITALIIIVLVLLQGKNAGFANLFGAGSTNIYSTKRGAEKFLFYATIVISIIFVASITANLFI
ncbi:MAG TPA: preprotein translocase subunit SecG [bacterium]|nr:preprotein translocase subunit SecG [Patescibacteria group bacterium]HPO11084.1 preprotein translocase subunit SecG [bacterium]